MSTAAWIFLVGMRVIDLGGLVIWLVWFFRQRDEPDDWDEWDDRGREPPPPERPTPPGPGGGAIRLPSDAGPWPARLRDHTQPHRARIDRRGAPERREREPERC